jgi:preprotein translocase subunit SecA
VLGHLQAQDWFVDEQRFDGLQSLRLGDLDKNGALNASKEATPADLQRELLDTLRRQQVEHLRRRRLADLDPDERREVVNLIADLNAELPENQMRPLQRKRVRELDQGVYHALLESLGGELVVRWGSTQFQDLDEEERTLLSAYLGRRIMGRIERRVLLHTISRLWIGYLTDIEDLRRGIGLEAYGQRDPLVEYKRRAFELFEDLGGNIRRTTVRALFQQPPQPLRAQ